MEKSLGNLRMVAGCQGNNQVIKGLELSVLPTPYPQSHPQPRPPGREEGLEITNCQWFDQSCLCQLKKYAQPKSWELCFIHQIFLGLQAQEAASQVTLRELLRGVVWEGYIWVLQQRAGGQNKTLLLIKENQMSQVKEFSAFLSMGRCKRLGSRQSSLWYGPQLPVAGIPVFSSLSSLRAHRTEWLQFDGC